MNTFGRLFRFTSFGESHGNAIGGVIEGCPSGLVVDINLINLELSYRKTGFANNIGSTRNEKDEVEFLSGIYEGKTLGTPIAFIIKNTDAKSQDYKELQNIFRPSHADYTYFKKYKHSNFIGGGRSSAREMAARVVAGAIAKQILFSLGIKIQAWTSSIGSISDSGIYDFTFREQIFSNPVRNTNKEIATKYEQLLVELKSNGDTIGGSVSCIIQNAPIGIGEPLFDKIQARLASAMMSINASRSFEWGLGIESSKVKGSQFNSEFYYKNNEIKLKNNNDGGSLGGISNGNPIFFKVSFKPISSIKLEQSTIDTQGNEKNIKIKGRHDICAAPRAVVVVESMAALSLLDLIMINNSTKDL